MFDYQLELILVIQQIVHVTAVIVGSPKSVTFICIAMPVWSALCSEEAS